MNLKKKIYLIFGFAFFGLGMFGYYMPLVPGTVFMILSAYCFMNSSEKLYKKITNNPVYGNSVKQYIEHHTIPFRAKIVILLSMWIATLIAISITPVMRFPLGIEVLNTNLILNLKVLAITLSAIGSIVVLRAKHSN